MERSRHMFVWKRSDIFYRLSCTLFGRPDLKALVSGKQCYFLILILATLVTSTAALRAALDECRGRRIFASIMTGDSATVLCEQNFYQTADTFKS